MVTIFINRNGQTEQVKSIDRVWLNPASSTFVWVDLAAPSIPELLILSDTFAFHPLSVEDARAELHYPKIEAYDGYLYAILHGIAFQTDENTFSSHDIDFFIGPNYLVTVHNGHSRSIAELHENAVRNPKVMAEGPVGLFHRIVDMMVDHYGPEMQKRSSTTRHPRSSARSSTRSDGSAACAGSSRHSGTSWRGWHAATSSTSAPTCRSASATYSITCSG